MSSLIRKVLGKIASIFRRDTRDPLLKEFYKRYKLHLLKLPREGSKIGDLYIYDGRDTLPPSRITSYLEPQIDLSSINSKTETERVADLSGKLSDKMDANVGINFLSGFFMGIGAGAVIDELNSKYETKKLKTLQFRFSNIVRDSIDPYWLEEKLSNFKFKPYDVTRVDEGYEFFIVTGRLMSDAVDLVSYDKSDNKIDLGLELPLVGGGTVGFGREKVGEGEIRFKGPKSLVFGVEICQYTYSNKEKRFRLKTTSRKVELRKKKGKTNTGRSKKTSTDVRTYIGHSANRRSFVD